MRTIFLTPLVIFLLISCKDRTASYKKLPETAQTLSFLGDTLKTNHKLLPEHLATRIDSLSQKALDDSLIANHLIWEARMTAYEGNYREAVNQYSEAIKQFPNDARLYRHRGHRYITLREFDLAIKDFKKAVNLIEGSEDEVEPDGLPNDQNKPLSTLHTNIWYHLGLAYYLEGDYEDAIDAYENGILATSNDDMLVANLYWYYMALRREGNDLLAGEMLKAVQPEMEIIENDSYHKLLLVFKGEFNPGKLLDDSGSSLQNATLGYGLGNWHFINGRKERAYQLWQQVYEGDNWAAFGFIASEVELAGR